MKVIFNLGLHLEKKIQTWTNLGGPNLNLARVPNFLNTALTILSPSYNGVHFVPDAVQSFFVLLSTNQFGWADFFVIQSFN
jgi:hypothetical protein